MNISDLKPHAVRPDFAFIAGWCVVMLSLTFSIGRPWDTFIHMWRVEFVASVFLAVFLIFLARRGKTDLLKDLSSSELSLIVLPVLAFIAWSAISLTWSHSWKSAVHHSLVWAEYLIFFLLARSVLTSRRNIGSSIAMLVSCLAFASIPALFGYVSYQIFGGGLSTGIIFQKYGEQVTAILPLVLIFVLRSDGRNFKFGIVGISALWLLVLCTLGRINTVLFVGAFLVTAILTFVFYSSPAVRRRAAVVVLVLMTIPTVLFVAGRLYSPDTIAITDRLAGNEATEGSNSFRKLMTSLSVEMITANPLIGVGADNFGFQLNEYRAAYGRRNPDDRDLANAESEIPERAHNELLQIISELGIVGGLIITWLIFGVGTMAFRAVRFKLFSPYRLAAFFGIGIFLVSSLVSSYSFRLIQNGFVFFFLLAIASRYFLKDRNTRKVERKLVEPRNVIVCGIAACLLLTLYSGIRVGSVVVTRLGDATPDIDQAAYHYLLASKLDDENPEAPNSLGSRLFFDKRFSEAVPHLERAIEIGRATSTDLSYLASAYTLAGDNIGAEKTMSRALALYPRSVFVLVRYASLARANGNAEKADQLMERALAIDARAANTWFELIANGPQRASEAAFKEKQNFIEVMDLRPTQAVYAVLDEREINFLGERRTVGF